ncbi:MULTISPECIES: hypothetical protein [unclassified Streptomyces]|uniref:hypothetical protein n=1 Tax=unclassified Streptomyces TaxID=2593676 RepID=UPI002E803B0F|nr:hypothetical protein [Streptomyces sp. NBC_00589]WTI40035.1 hypothetical protein OIC96_36140 [Streptomyces sp. NBC_00775]WUB26285.1 hypothetical protein OHA51_13590 [Streptomyces sp. NBC_00589]
MRVLISPSYGSTQTRRHWADTVDRQVDFTVPRHDGLLAADHRAQLQNLHPEGRARFWGATPAHDGKFSDVATGDVVLFTGGNRVRAIGEVGAIFRNREFADLLWPPQADGPSWHTVYSLLDLVPADIPYAELNAAIGYKPAHNFPGQMVLRGDKASAVLEDFMITPGTEWPAPPSATALRQSDDRARDVVRIAAMEELRTRRTGYQQTRRLIVVDRREAELVREYRRYLGARGQTATRFYCPSGISDMYLENAGQAEIVEAKSSPAHRHVRQALAQLLDYAPHSPVPARCLTALFPEPPEREDVQLLHRYGIDCVHRENPGAFRRQPASGERRALMRGVWAGIPGLE